MKRNKMKNSIFIILLSVFFQLPAQALTLKEQAMEAFKREHYDDAIHLMQEALKENPADADIYYYLGFFTHYRAYDSRPLKGYDFAYSQQIFDYLERAIELNPQYGDAKYFYSAECGSNAIVAMQNYDLESLKYWYKKAYEKETFPPWLLEVGRNLLDSCDENAILFTGGDADFNVCMYLQLHENYRQDITVAPFGLINRPWYVKFLKDGLEGGVRKINMSLTDEQIMNIHPFKWRTTTVSIPVSDKMKEEFSLAIDYQFEWEVAPDLWSGRMHSKIEGEEETKRTYLSPTRAILLQILEDNYVERPIFVANFASPHFYEDLGNYLQNWGLASRLIPVNTENNPPHKYNIKKLEELLQIKNLQDLPNVKTEGMPRVTMVFIYHSITKNLLEYYKENNELEKMQQLLDFYKSNIYPNIAVSSRHEEIARYYLNTIMEIMEIME